MKNCPYCAEEIQDDAIKCRFCGEYLSKELKSKKQKTSIFKGCLIGCLFLAVWLFLGFIALSIFGVIVTKKVTQSMRDLPQYHLENLDSIFKQFLDALRQFIIRIKDLFNGGLKTL